MVTDKTDFLGGSSMWDCDEQKEAKHIFHIAKITDKSGAALNLLIAEGILKLHPEISEPEAVETAGDIIINFIEEIRKDG